MSCNVTFLVDTSFLGNEISESCNIGVHSGERGFTTPNSPGNEAGQSAINNQRAARITLASVFTSTGYTGTDHILSDSAIF
jgi:hypothetical protein